MHNKYCVVLGGDNLINSKRMWPLLNEYKHKDIWQMEVFVLCRCDQLVSVDLHEHKEHGLNSLPTVRSSVPILLYHDINATITRHVTRTKQINSLSALYVNVLTYVCPSVHLSVWMSAPLSYWLSVCMNVSFHSLILMRHLHVPLNITDYLSRLIASQLSQGYIRWFQGITSSWSPHDCRWKNGLPISQLEFR